MHVPAAFLVGAHVFDDGAERIAARLEVGELIERRAGGRQQNYAPGLTVSQVVCPRCGREHLTSAFGDFGA